jgi:hypothetical protein
MNPKGNNRRGTGKDETTMEALRKAEAEQIAEGRKEAEDKAKAAIAKALKAKAAKK